jgi:capsid protein
MFLNFYPIETEAYLGLPWLTPSLGNVWDNQQIFEDKMKQSRILSRLGIRINKKDRDSFDEAADSVADTGESYMDLDFQGLVAAEDGSLQAIKLDDSLKESFNPLLKNNLIQLAVGMGISYQVISSDLEGMNFAASRANIINDNRFFRAIFKWYTKTVLQRRYERFVEMEIFQGKVPGVTYQMYLDDPWYYTQCYWLPMDGEEWVDPLRDAESIKLLYGLGQVTYQEICAMSGKDYRSTYAQLKKERDMFKADDMEHLLPGGQVDTTERREALLLEKPDGDEEK